MATSHMGPSDFALKAEQFCWVAFLDTYGFSSEVRSRKGQSITKMLTEFGSVIHSIRHDLDGAFQFSDSIFLINSVYPNPVVALTKIFQSTRHLQNTAVKFRFALRGAVCAGPVTITDFGCFGEPVERAVRLEAHLASPTVFLPSRDLLAAQEYITQQDSDPLPFQFPLSTRTVMTKTGEIDGYILKPPLRSFADLAHTQIVIAHPRRDGIGREAPVWAM